MIVAINLATLSPVRNGSSNRRNIDVDMAIDKTSISVIESVR